MLEAGRGERVAGGVDRVVRRDDGREHRDQHHKGDEEYGGGSDTVAAREGGREPGHVAQGRSARSRRGDGAHLDAVQASRILGSRNP